MSELNKKKNNLLFKILIGYTILIILAIGILFFLYKKFGIEIDLSSSQKINNVEVPISKEENDNIERSDILDKYYINNLEVEEKILHFGNIVDYSGYDNAPIYKVTVNYFKIDGLKDKVVQNAINSTIEERAKSAVLDEDIYNDSIDTVNINIYTFNSGFSDLISAEVTKNITYKSKNINDYQYEFEYLPSINFRLDTGDELKLEDIFTKDASIKNILAQSVYKEYAYEYGLNSESGLGNLDEIDYGKIENDVFNIVNKFNTQKERNFWFNQQNIYIEIDNQIFNIETPDFMDYINFNNIVKVSESLYKNGNNPKINYVFSIPFISSFEYFDKISNDSYLSVFNIYKPEGKISDGDWAVEYTNKLKENIPTIIDIIKNDTKKEKGKGYVYNIYMYQEEYYDENQLKIGPVYLGEKVEVDLEDFEKNAETVYALNCRQPTGGDFSYNLTNLVRIKKV